MPSDHLGRLKMSSGLAQSGSKSGSSRNTVQVIPDATYRLHGDFNRDGAVDSGTWFDAPTWQWGAGNPGAIIAFNNDDDGARSSRLDRGLRDFTDDRVNANDVEIAPLEIRRHGGTRPLAASFKASLEVLNGNERNIRIFNGRTAGRSEMIGPARGNRAPIHDMAALGNSVTLGMEALRYAGRGFNGLIDIRLTVYVYDYDRRLSDIDNFDIMENVARVHETTYVRVRVAPWIIPHHLDRAERVYVVTVPNTDSEPNDVFRGNLDTLVQAAGCAFDQGWNDHDRWMQDCMEIGYSVMPAATRPHRYTSILRCFRDRELFDLPATLAGRDLGWFEPRFFADWQNASIAIRNYNTFDSGGNIETTPPVRDETGNAYPFGRVYFGAGRFGSRFDGTVSDFFDAQVVQAPIRIDTNWLGVGHVDEMMSFVPRRTIPVIPSTTTPNPYKRWKLVIANPHLAYQILDAAQGTDRILVNRQLRMGFREWQSNWVDVPVFDWRDVEYWEPNWVNIPRVYYDGTAERWDGNIDLFQPIARAGYRRSGPDSAPYRVFNTFTRREEDNFQRENRPIRRTRRAFVQVGTRREDRGRFIVRDRWAVREQSVDDFLNHDTLIMTTGSSTYLTGRALRRLNEDLWRNSIEPTLQQLAVDISLAPEDVIHAPVIFYPSNAMHTEFGALTGDIVNMLMINGHCIPPMAFGPIGTRDRECHFQQRFRRDLEAEGLTVSFLDDWYEYHAKHGEVHCGTNTLRLPDPLNDWLESAAARWWEFTP